jgi:ribosomal protein L37AE/L43A
MVMSRSFLGASPLFSKCLLVMKGIPVIDIISSTVNALNILREVTERLIVERDRQKLLALEIEFQKRFAELQTKFIEISSILVEQRATGERQQNRITELEAEHAERQRYELSEIGAFGKFFAYRLRDPSELTERVSEPPHFLCQPCFDAGKKGILRRSSHGYWSCPLCNAGFAEDSGG